MRTFGHAASPWTRFIARAAVGGTLVASTVVLTAGVAAANDKVTICHRTDSNTNPYVQITVDVNAANGGLGKGGNDHTHHTGPVFNPTLKSHHIKWGDIIPPYTFSSGSYPGLNWGADGQSIWNRGCTFAGPDLAMDKIGTAVAQPGDSVSYTLTVTNAADADATYGPITVSDTLPAGLSGGVLTPVQDPGAWTCSGLQCVSDTVVVLPGSSIVFTVSATVDAGIERPTTLHDVADVSTPGDTDPSNDEDSADTDVPEAVDGTPPSPLTLSAACDPANDGSVVWTVTNPDGNDTATALVVHGATGTVSPASVDGGQSGTFSTDTGHSVHVTGTVDQQPVDSNTVGFSDPCLPGGPTPVSNPTAQATHSCKAGLRVTLGNLDGTAPADFTVTHNGSSHVVTVRAGAIRREDFTVREDTTGRVRVEAAGLSTRTFSFHKDCATVLGEKVTRTPGTQPAAEGQLPMTGSPSGRLADLGLVLLGTGAAVAGLGRRRPRTG